MKIEFKKVPFTQKSFNFIANSVKLEGTFCRISPTLVKIKGTLDGQIKVDCCMCGKEFETEISEELDLVISQGLFEAEAKFDEIIIETMDDFVDFEEIVESEIESIKADYFVCDVCAKTDEELNYEI